MERISLGLELRMRYVTLFQGQRERNHGTLAGGCVGVGSVVGLWNISFRVIRRMLSVVSWYISHSVSQ